MIVTLLFHKTIVSCRQAPTRPLAVEHHGNNEQRDTQTDESTGNEHILETIALDPRRNSKRNSNADGVAEECYSREGVAGDLSKEKRLETHSIDHSGFEMAYITVTIDNQGQSGIANTAKSESEKGSANAGVDPVHTLGIKKMSLCFL
jgi:hypothetical protein